MKTLSSICSKTLNDWVGSDPTVCEYVMSTKGPYQLSQPIISTDYSCAYCGSEQHFCPYLDPKVSLKRMWLCANLNCVTYSEKKHNQATYTPNQSKRAIVWPLFCEYSGVGDRYHDLRFEDIKQSAGKLTFLLKFATQPNGIVLMQGTPGTGKTYACLGVCEMFTRASTSCIFNTQKQMLNNWLDTFKSEKVSNYIQRVTNCNLLVVDDFGTGDISPGFMSFFMDLVNSRMQWTDRGTIITTNLSDTTFTEFCGAALNDRIRTGQKMLFNEESRRKQTLL